MHGLHIKNNKLYIPCRLFRGFDIKIVILNYNLNIAFQYTNPCDPFRCELLINPKVCFITFAIYISEIGNTFWIF